jgi:arylsulfatase A-like enzyme
MRHPTRRHLLAAAGVAPAAAQTGAGARRPNILFILSDDHSYPYLGCYSGGIRSPNLDRLAAGGMRFDRMFTVAPQCVPSRAGYLTGRSAVAARTTRFSSALPPGEITIPEVLRESGYYTGVCGRMFHLDGSGRLGPITESLMRKHNFRTFQRRVDYLDPGSAQDRVHERLDEFLGRVPQGRPFFMWLNYSDPHHVWTNHVPGMRHDPARVEVPPYLPDLPGVRGDLARYFDEIAHLDALIENVFGVLRRRGVFEDTLILFTGDNGMAFPHGKGSLYDPGLHVPLLVHWPGAVKPGRTSAELISGEDIAPTLIEAAGARVPERMSGKSFLPLLRGDSFQARQYIFAERGPHGHAAYTLATRSASFDQSRCVRSARWKLIYNCTPHQQYWPVDCGNDPVWREMVAAHVAGDLKPEHERMYFARPRPVLELFDLDKDPGELNNLAGRPETAETERELKIALTEKMMLDYDYLPLPIASTE